MADPDRNMMGGDSVNESDRTRELMLEIEALKLKLELEKMRSSRASSEEPENRNQHTGIGRYAKELKAVLAPMPTNEPMIPAWFKNVDALFAALSIPEEIQGTIILPFLTDKMRTFVANQSEAGVMPYSELKSRVLKELRMTPSEYRRMFLEIKREADESWSQVTARLETMFTYYLRSREVQSFESLQELLIADRLKQLMPSDLRSLVTQQEIKGWLKPKDIAELAANFEEGLDSTRQSNYRGTAPRNQNYRPQAKPFASANFTPNSGACFGCGQRGHFQRDCEFSLDTAASKAEVLRVAPQNARSFESRATPSRHTALMKNSLMRDPRIEILVGNRPCFARIDSGADITVVRANEVSAEILDQSNDRIRLTGAFGQGVTARLMYVPLGLPPSSGSAAQRVKLLCAVTDQLTTSASVLLTPADYECLRHCRQNLLKDLEECDKGMSCVAQEVGPEQYSPMREAERVSLGSSSSANAEQRTLEEAPSSEHQVINTEAEAGTALEDEGEREGGAQALEPQTTNSVSLAEQGQLEGCKSVGESTFEDSERLGLVSENSFVGEQKRDEPLADVRQAVSPVKVDIGGGLRMNSGAWIHIQGHQKDSLFVKDLILGIWPKEQLKNRSLQGKHCPRFLDQPAKTPLTPWQV
ncbi:hypothetical protein MTO96_006051 [Rhipicephalus appendiculatus]